MFFVNAADLADRMSIVLTLFLTVLAVKFLVGDKLPAVPFLTIIDQYMFGCVVAFALVMAEAPCAAAFAQPPSTDAVVVSNESNPGVVLDKVFRYVWLAGWVLFNIGMFIVGLTTLRHNDRMFPPVVLQAGKHTHSALQAHEQLKAQLARARMR